MIIHGNSDFSSTSMVNFGSSSHATGTAYGYGNTDGYSGTTMTFNNSAPVQKPKVQLTVEFFEKQPEGKYLEMFNIESKITELSGKYKINHSE